MTPNERWALALKSRRHSIPVVERRFLSDDELQVMAGRRCAANDPPDFRRASGDNHCEICGVDYHSHPRHDPHNYLTVLCDGIVVKL